MRPPISNYYAPVLSAMQGNIGNGTSGLVRSGDGGPYGKPGNVAGLGATNGTPIRGHTRMARLCSRGMVVGRGALALRA